MFEKDGSGGFTEVDEFPAPSYLSCAIMLDFDEDGDIDLALTDEIADVVVLHPNLGIDLPEPTPACAPTPEPCRTPTASGKSQLQIKNTAPDDKDRLEWKWKAGAAITLGEYGDISLVGYDLCLYDDGAFVTGQTVPAGATTAGKPATRPRASTTRTRSSRPTASRSSNSRQASRVRRPSR